MNLVTRAFYLGLDDSNRTHTHIFQTIAIIIYFELECGLWAGLGTEWKSEVRLNIITKTVHDN